MSDLEKHRALTLVAVVAAALFGLFAYQSRGVSTQHSGIRDPLELCAASKGALCDETPADTVAAAPGTPATAQVVHELGRLLVSAPRVRDETTKTQVALLGSITVTAPRA
jgi:hypothetical protein